MRLFSMQPDRIDDAAILEAVAALRLGELVVFPTETVYGLAADARNDAAVRRVFCAKGRPASQPLPVQVASVDLLPGLVSSVPEAARRLAAQYWPGPLTLVLPAADDVSELITAGTGAVGVRVPDHPVALVLLGEFGAPVIATSANLSGQPPPRSAQEAVQQVGDQVAVVLDAGQCPVGVVSTVVGVATEVPRLIREGAIPASAIREVAGELERQ